MTTNTNVTGRFDPIETERLRLREFRTSDTAGYTELLTDESTYPFISDIGPVAPENVLEKIARMRAASRTAAQTHRRTLLLGYRARR